MRDKVMILHKICTGSGVTITPGEEGSIIKKNDTKSVVEMDRGGVHELPNWTIKTICERDDVWNLINSATKHELERFPSPPKFEDPVPIEQSNSSTAVPSSSPSSTSSPSLVSQSLSDSPPESVVVGNVSSQLLNYDSSFNLNSSLAGSVRDGPKRKVSFTDGKRKPEINMTHYAVGPLPTMTEDPMPIPEINIESFSDSSSSSDDEDSEVGITLAQKRWRFLRRNLHNVRSGMTRSDYHSVIKEQDRRRFTRNVQEVRRKKHALQPTPAENANAWKFLKQAIESGRFKKEQKPEDFFKLSSFHDVVQLLRRRHLLSKGNDASAELQAGPALPTERLTLAMAELLETERTFVTQLKMITKYFQPAIQPIIARDSRRASDAALIFGNIAVLIRIHSALLAGLEKHQRERVRLDNVGWIIQWPNEDDVRMEKNKKHKKDKKRSVQVPPEAALREYLSKRRGLDELQLLMNFFKDQVTSRGGASAVFRILDANEDGCISREEFWTYCREKLLLSNEATTRVFHELDVDEDGSIRFDELESITTAGLFQRWCKEVMKLGEGRQVFNKIDTDKNGIIDFDEFVSFAQQIGFTSTEATTIFAAISSSKNKLTQELFCKPLGLSVLDQSTDIGELLQLVVPLVHFAYSQYANNFDTAREAHARFKQLPAFEKACEEVVTSGNTCDFDLSDLLITPIQRMLRYSLLLKKIREHVPFPETHSAPIALRIEEAISRITELNQLVDKSVATKHNYEKLKTLANNIIFRDSTFNLIAKDRKLLRSGTLTRICRSGQHKRCRFYLFSDILIYVTNARCKHVMQLDNVDLLDMEDQPNLKHAWMIKSPKVSFVVFSDTFEDKVSWTADILSTSDVVRKENPQWQRQPLAPVWAFNASTSTCAVCERAFNLFRRKHHCYHCGSIVCRDCANHKFFLPSINEKEMVQVCRLCFNGLCEEREGEPSPSISRHQSRTTANGGSFCSVKGPFPQDRRERFESLVSRQSEGSPAIFRRKSFSGSPGGTASDVFTMDLPDASSFNGSFPSPSFCLPTPRGEGDIENSSMILGFQNRFIGPRKPTLAKPGRRFILSGLFRKKHAKGGWGNRAYRFILFTDVLIYCSEVIGKKLYFRKMLPLLHMKVEAEGKDAMRIISTVKSFVVKLYTNKAVSENSSSNAMEDWMFILEKTIRLHRERAGGTALDGVTAAVPEDAGNACSSCCKSFSILTGKQNCKACGKLFCKQCVSKTYYTSPGVKGSVCPQCYEDLRGVTVRLAADITKNPEHNPPEESRATCCYVCDSKFTLLRRKEVCWSCCGAVCSACSPNKTILPRLDPDNPLKVCNPCFQGLQAQSLEVTKKTDT
eukprot:TRINITY_DN12431_c0_g1_i1.p1 TRINITY_DN12431_c0_g1~~TRINITY_DN12431_c0_g1_i1.p1  ORF type:complete len:1443 (+),score=265.92 TRINITY_DN12431_c0_g1_i1:306-4331(+)